MKRELINKKARRDYLITDEVEAGVVLSGGEVKSLRVGRGNLSEAFVKLEDGEAWLINFLIPAYQEVKEGYDPGKRRKLLLNKRELLSMKQKIDGKRLALVPLKAYFKNGRRVKILVGLGKGKRSYDKKEALKKKDIKRELRREFKEAQIR